MVGERVVVCVCVCVCVFVCVWWGFKGYAKWVGGMLRDMLNEVGICQGIRSMGWGLLRDVLNEIGDTLRYMLNQVEGGMLMHMLNEVGGMQRGMLNEVGYAKGFAKWGGVC